MIDLASFDTTVASDKGVKYELKHPAFPEQGIGVYIHIMGRDASTFLVKVKSKVNERLRKEAMANRANRISEIDTVESTEEKTIENLAILTLGWGNIVDEKYLPGSIELRGEHLEFTTDNAHRLYKDQKWIRDQLDTVVVNMENFFPR